MKDNNLRHRIKGSKRRFEGVRKTAVAARSSEIQVVLLSILVSVCYFSLCSQCKVYCHWSGGYQ